MSASREMASGAALRATAISVSRSIRYWSSGAMLGSAAFASCTGARHAALSKITRAKLRNAIVLTIFRFIDFLRDRTLPAAISNVFDAPEDLSVGQSSQSLVLHFTTVTCSRASLYVPNFFATTFSVG